MPLDNSRGLTSEEARKRLKEFGPNRIFTPAKVSFLAVAREEVTEPMILLLLVVGVFYSIWGRLGDAITIFVVIVLLVLAEVYNEYRAKKAIASLHEITAPTARVLRDGRMLDIPAETVVPSDILIVTPGTIVAADGAVGKSMGIQVDESALTGESFPQSKSDGDLLSAGTTILSGEGSAEVRATGKETRIGRMADALKTVRPPRTPLQLAMRSLAKRLVYVALFFSILIPVIGIARGQDTRMMILTGLSLAFATIPEELPIIITMVLGLGAYTLSRKQFLVKRLQTAETLGNATVIVTDKTGTVTEDRMKIASVWPQANEKEIIEKALGATSEYSVSPLEASIKEKAHELGMGEPTSDIVRERHIGEQGRKTKAVLRRYRGSLALFVAGAPEEVRQNCGSAPRGFEDRLKEETGKGRRVIAAAHKIIDADQGSLAFSELERGMELIGLISFEDPPRQGVRETVKAVRRAGVRTIMVTGDHPLTARSVAAEIGIDGDIVLTGAELDGLSDEEMTEKVRSVSVFARATPTHKYRIVRALQEIGEVVAVTGDGVNDALALKAADIGIAMGRQGTDVAKDAAEAVLADDNYITITQSLFEGRKFFDNLRKGVTYYLSAKLALILIFLVPALLNIPMPFSPIQIIVLELFMDLAASAGFVAEPGQKDIYSRQPRKPKESLLGGPQMLTILLNGAALFVTVMAVYFYARYRGLGVTQTQTYAFTAWMFGHIFLAFVSRSGDKPVLAIGPFTNNVINLWGVTAVAFLIAAIYIPLLRERFHLASADPFTIASIAAAALLLIGMLELRKVVRPVQFKGR